MPKPIVACDFCLVASATFRILYVFIVMEKGFTPISSRFMKYRYAALLIIVALMLAACAEPSTDEEKRYADQPDLAVIHQYVVTGHMPSQVPLQPGGPIGLLFQGVGLMPKTQPVSADLQIRAIAAKKELDAACWAGDIAACRPQVDIDCRNGDAGACRTLCQLGDRTACTEYSRLLCELEGPWPCHQ
jgi:hypothetical protein